MRIDAAARPADLQVRIAARSTLDRRMFRCRVQTPHLPDFALGREEDWDVPELVDTLVGKYMAAFTKSGSTPLERRIALLGAGRQLFEITPSLFREALFRLLDEGKPLETIAIVSAEPFLPWEILVPKRAGETWKEPLGARFLLSRWSSTDGVAPPQTIPLTNSHVLAPKDSKLASSQEEIRLVTGAFAGDAIEPATLEGLEAALAAGGRSLLHYVGYGKSKEGSQVLILEGRQELVADFLPALEGVSGAVREHRPFIFLNACEVGRAEPALVGAGGFAQELREMGASAVVAPLWSVKDSIAHTLATAFYREVKSKPSRPFAAILRDLRKRSFEPAAEDSWVAYVFYGDPWAAQLPGR